MSRRSQRCSAMWNRRWKKLREARQREVDRQYRGAILAYLAASNGAEVRSTEYFAALDAYYEGHFEEALHHLDAIGSGLPWLYEASELRGDTLFARALTFRKQGEKERARNDLEAGRKAYAAAAGIARSVPPCTNRFAELERAAMAMEMYSQGEVMPMFTRALAATAHALEVAPDHYEALVLEARLRRNLAEHEANRGGDVPELLAPALDAALRAVEISPTRSEARFETRADLPPVGRLSKQPKRRSERAVPAGRHDLRGHPGPGSRCRLFLQPGCHVHVVGDLSRSEWRGWPGEPHTGDRSIEPDAADERRLDRGEDQPRDQPVQASVPAARCGSGWRSAANDRGVRCREIDRRQELGRVLLHRSELPADGPARAHARAGSEPGSAARHGRISGWHCDQSQGA